VARMPVLLVEGKNDQHVICALLQHHSVPETFQVEPMEGIDRLLETVPVRLKLTDLGRLGVVIDANADLQSRWRSIMSILANAGYGELPEGPSPGGTILDPPDGLRPTVGVWIMPNNRLPGELEDFIQFLVPEGDSLIEHAKSSVADAAAIDRRFDESDRSKAEVHTWLAWQARPGQPMGTAITAKFLDPEAEHARALVEWIRRLFCA
jgi:hypothetical protein